MTYNKLPIEPQLPSLATNPVANGQLKQILQALCILWAMCRARSYFLGTEGLNWYGLIVAGWVPVCLCARACLLLVCLPALLPAHNLGPLPFDAARPFSLWVRG